MPAPSVLLVARAQTGDRVALDQLLAALQDRLLDQIIAIVGDRDESLDVLQDALLTIARKLPTLRDPRWCRAWAYRIATRQALRRRRNDHVWATALRGEALEGVATEQPESPFDPELLAALPTHVAALPPACGLVMRMHYLDGLSYEEISEALDLAPGTVKSRLAYGRNLLRARLR